jgi:hypothetical protein
VVLWNLCAYGEGVLTHREQRNGTAVSPGTRNGSADLTAIFFMCLVASLFVGSKRALLVPGYEISWVSAEDLSVLLLLGC